MSDYTCGNCGGSGEDICLSCDSEITCEECKGTGLDDELIDAMAFQAAARTKSLKSSSCGLIEKGKTVGRKFGDGSTLLYADFRRDLDPSERPPEPFRYCEGQRTFIDV